MPWWKSKPTSTGWPVGVCCAIFTAFCALILNLAVAISFSARYATKDGLGTFYESDCAAVDHMSNWLHLAINIIGSLLLAASNYCMQCLAAPTRADCDRAHAKNDWLDIGILSVRNVVKLGGWRSIILLLLALSSLPIHLVYNSTIIKTVTANYYHAIVVDDGFLRGDPIIFNSRTYFPQRYLDIQESWLVNGSSFTNLSKTDCVNEFATDYVSTYSNLLLVTVARNDSIGNVYGTLNGPGLPYDGTVTGDTLDISHRNSAASYDWLCPSKTPHCSTTSLRANSSNLEVEGQKISYCLAEQAPAHCQVQFSTTLFITVIICNAIKVIAMIATLFLQTSSVLVVIGDAIESFLLRPDQTTTEVTTLRAKDVYTSLKPLKSTWSSSSRPKRWLVALRPEQWISFFCVSVGALTGTAILFSMAMSTAQSQHSRQPALSIPLGTSTPATIIISLFDKRSDAEATTTAVLLGNLPQLVMSCAYVLFNNMFTSMLLAYEWSTYATKRKPLRVTRPHDEQISTYWLQLPFVYGVSLLVISAVMHWLISQALFMVRLQTRRIGFVSNTWITSTHMEFGDLIQDVWPPPPLSYNGSEALYTTDYNAVYYPNHTHPLSIFQDDVRTNRSALAYSPIAILCVLAVGSFLCIGIFVFGALRRFKSNMPIAASCSLAIAAACHPPDTDADCSSRSVRWCELDGSSSEMPTYSFTTFEDRVTLTNTSTKV